MDDIPIIYIDRLRDGHVEQIESEIAPNFISVSDEDVSFPERVRVKGRAYLAEDQLILHLSIQTQVLCRCVICNEKALKRISLQDVYHTEELSQIKGAVFSTAKVLREMILLEVPAFFECHSGECPSRELVNSYLKKENSKHESLIEHDEGYHPFSHLAFEDSHVKEKDKN